MSIRVAVAGAAGHMGQTVCEAVDSADDMTLTGRADPALGTTVADVVARADVLVDFTQPDQALANAREAAAAGVHVVIGTSGFDVAGLDELSGANVLFTAALAKFHAQAIRKVYDIGWRPMQFVDIGALSLKARNGYGQGHV